MRSETSTLGVKILNKNNSGYSVIISLLIIWFLLVLTTGIFNLILNELKDNRAMGDYIKAYAWAESARELALLDIKKEGYGYYDKINHEKNDRSVILSSNPLNKNLFNPNKDILISYDIWSKVNEYEWTLDSLEHDIVPLFYVDSTWEKKTNSIIFEVTQWSATDVAWNIIWENTWLSWKWINTTGVKKILVNGIFDYSEKTINEFLVSSDSNYFHLVNTWNSKVIYRITSSEFFTKPETTIISSAEVWGYKQNLSTELDNTEFLNILKYSIYSN